jgi:hypothetical protein
MPSFYRLIARVHSLPLCINALMTASLLRPRVDFSNWQQLSNLDINLMLIDIDNNHELYLLSPHTILFEIYEVVLSTYV